jgi:hypothetical protein
MTALTAVCFLLGTVLALRVNFFTLVPITIITAIVSWAENCGAGNGAWPTWLVTMLNVTALHSGYLGSATLLAFSQRLFCERLWYKSTELAWRHFKMIVYRCVEICVPTFTRSFANEAKSSNFKLPLKEQKHKFGASND